MHQPALEAYGSCMGAAAEERGLEQGQSRRGHTDWGLRRITSSLMHRSSILLLGAGPRVGSGTTQADLLPALRTQLPLYIA